MSAAAQHVARVKAVQERRQSGSICRTGPGDVAIRGDRLYKNGNKSRKRELFISGFAAVKDLLSRACCDKKCSEGKRRNPALIAPAR